MQPNHINRWAKLGRLKPTQVAESDSPVICPCAPCLPRTHNLESTRGNCAQAEWWQEEMLSGHCLCFGSPHNPVEQTAGLRLSHPEKGSMIDSDIAPFTEGRIWESCLEEASIELRSKEYRSYLTDEIVQWPVMRMPCKPGHSFLILSYRG